MLVPTVFLSMGVTLRQPHSSQTRAATQIAFSSAALSSEIRKSAEGARHLTAHIWASCCLRAWLGRGPHGSMTMNRAPRTCYFSMPDVLNSYHRGTHQWPILPTDPYKAPVIQPLTQQSPLLSQPEPTSEAGLQRVLLRSQAWGMLSFQNTHS